MTTWTRCSELPNSSSTALDSIGGSCIILALRAHIISLPTTVRVEYGTPVGRELEKLLKIPIAQLNDILSVLDLRSFRPLLDTFDFFGRKSMACFIGENVLENETRISEPDRAETVLATLATLVADQEDGEEWEDQEEFAEEQGTNSSCRQSSQSSQQSLG